MRWEGRGEREGKMMESEKETAYNEQQPQHHAAIVIAKLRTNTCSQ